MPPAVEPSLLASSRAWSLRTALLAWYDGARRSLPWRAAPGQSVSAWAVLVSEIMLQQTTAATVAGRFAAFIDRFPTPDAMAAQPLDAVLHAWQGLGYYRRARALHACARAVVDRHAGAVPDDPIRLRDLPGIGDYTARAVAAIAFGRPVVPIDANVRRVLARLLGTADEAVIRAAADGLADQARPGDLAQALMELGALVCTARRAACLVCPWQPGCVAAASGQPLAHGLGATRQTRSAQTAIAYLLRRADGAILFHRRPDRGLLAGMNELPTSPFLAAGTRIEPDDHAPVRASWRPLPGAVRHLFTHVDLTVQVVTAPDHDGSEDAVRGLWTLPRSLGALALPTLTRKLLRHAGIAPPPAAEAAQRRQASVT